MTRWDSCSLGIQFKMDDKRKVTVNLITSRTLWVLRLRYERLSMYYVHRGDVCCRKRKSFLETKQTGDVLCVISLVHPYKEANRDLEDSGNVYFDTASSHSEVLECVDKYLDS